MIARKRLTDGEESYAGVDRDELEWASELLRRDPQEGQSENPEYGEPDEFARCRVHSGG
jgi:hypothetical protein